MPMPDLSKLMGPLVFNAPIEIHAAKTPEDEKKPTHCSIQAYDGKPMNVGFGYPLLVNLATLQIPNQAIPILDGHNPAASAVLGKTTSIVKGESSLSEEVDLFANADPVAASIVAKSKAGFKWQASVGTTRGDFTFVAEGEEVKANGQTFQGPLILADNCVLYETSIVALGAASQTSVAIAAKHNSGNTGKENKMPKGTENQAAGNEAGAAPTQAAPENINASLNAENNIKAARAQYGIEATRIEAINKIEGDPGIKAKGIAEGWSPEKTELAVVRAARPAAPGIVTKNTDTTAEILAAGLVIASTPDRIKVEAAYKGKTEILEKAEKFRSLSLKGLIEAACCMSGVATPSISASPEDWIRAAFSTASVSNILKDASNKTLLSSFYAADEMETLKKLTRQVSAKDFKAVNLPRLYILGGLESVKGDKLAYKEINDSNFTVQAATRGAVIGIGRTDLVNDDLGAFMQLPSTIGNTARRTMMLAFFAYIEAASGTLFHADNKNVDTSAAVPSLAGYKLLDKLFGAMKDQNGDKIGAKCRYVLTPMALSADAKTMFSSTQLFAEARNKDATAAVVKGNGNPYANTYEPLSSSYLTNDSVWYGFADPALIAAFSLATLNGRLEPVVEDVSDRMPGDTLGMQWRVYHDYGFGKADPQGAVRMS